MTKTTKRNSPQEFDLTRIDITLVIDFVKYKDKEKSLYIIDTAHPFYIALEELGALSRVPQSHGMDNSQLAEQFDNPFIEQAALIVLRHHENRVSNFMQLNQTNHQRYALQIATRVVAPIIAIAKEQCKERLINLKHRGDNKSVEYKLMQLFIEQSPAEDGVIYLLDKLFDDSGVANAYKDAYKHGTYANAVENHINIAIQRIENKQSKLTDFKKSSDKLLIILFGIVCFILFVVLKYYQISDRASR